MPDANPAEKDAAVAAPAPRKLLGVNPIKWVFALEYVLQGLANPFQGTTYQPFFKHLRVDYGLSEAAVQSLFARSYLAWSFKPVLGFFIDAYGRTRSLLLVLLGLGVIGYLTLPLFDLGPGWFFWFMFVVSVAFAGTDVAVDRATVIEGAEESKNTGRSKATTVGLNQAICWASVYGSAILAALFGGYAADHLPLHGLMAGLALVPLLVFLVVWKLPRDRIKPIPVTRSIAGFWAGLNTGPILGVMAFFFIFNLPQPMSGPIWNNYMIESLHFTQAQIGRSDAASYVGYFLGVLLFAWKGLRWQEQLGLRKLFRIFILLSIVTNLTQYLQVDPWFSTTARGLSAVLPLEEGTVRLVYLCAYNLVLTIPLSLIRMSTFSLVGSVVPTSAAGSLFAGFMSVANLATSFSYQGSSWLYEHGLDLGLIRALQSALFGLPGKAGNEMSVNMLILMNSVAFLVSFVCVHVLPDRRETQATESTEAASPGPERWRVLDPRIKRALDVATIGVGLLLFGTMIFAAGFEPISAGLICFFSITLLRKAVLDTLLRRAQLAPA